jgi:EmrB/QacA subfamily drug resistance transporter
MSSQTVHTEYPDHIDRAVLKIAGVVVLGAIMSILDITVVNVALPTFQREFGTPDDPIPYSHVAWTVTGYTLALATVIPLTGWAADRFGTKRLYMTAIALFTAGSALCATAWDINVLIAFRVLQGLGGGMLMPLGMTIMTRAAGPHRMGRLMAILGVPMLLGPIMGPILGGWLIETASWHWIFLINVPLGIGALVYAWFVLEKDSPQPSESFDFVGMALMSPGLALFLFGVSSLPTEGGDFSAPRVWVSMLVGVLLMLAFVWHSFRPEHPLLDLRLFHNRNLTLSVITMFMFAAAFFGGLLLVPTYFQQIRGESTLDAGLLVAPQGIGAMVTMPIAGRLVDKMPVGRIAPFGLTGIIIGMFGLTQVTATTPYWQLIVSLFVMGLGMGATMMPIFTSALKTLANHEVVRGGADVGRAHQPAQRLPGHPRNRGHPGPHLRPHRDPGGDPLQHQPDRVRQPEPRPRRRGQRTGRCCRGVRPHLLGLLGARGADPDPGADAPPQARGGPPPRRRGRAAGGRRLT